MKFSLLAIALALVVCSAPAEGSESRKPPVNGVDVFGAHRSAGKFRSNVLTPKRQATVVENADQSTASTAPKQVLGVVPNRFGHGLSQGQVEEQLSKLRKTQPQQKQAPESSQSEAQKQLSKLRKTQSQQKQTSESSELPNPPESTIPQDSASRFGVALRPAVRKEATSFNAQAEADSQSPSSSGNRFGVALRPAVRKEATSFNAQAGADSQSPSSSGNRFGVALRPTVREEATSNTQAGAVSQSPTSPGNRFGVQLKSLRK